MINQSKLWVSTLGLWLNLSSRKLGNVRFFLIDMQWCILCDRLVSHKFESRCRARSRPRRCSTNYYKSSQLRACLPVERPGANRRRRWLAFVQKLLERWTPGANNRKRVLLKSSTNKRYPSLPLIQYGESMFH